MLKKLETIRKKLVPVKIGSIAFKSKILLAPLAGITNRPLRELMALLGAGGAITELISCHAINYKNKKTEKMLTLGENEFNTGIQIFGEDVDCLADASMIATKFNPAFIDINMGCPVRKVVTKGAGAALMRDPKKVAEIIKIVKSRINIPLTIKIRLGESSTNLNALDIVKIAESEGVNMVSIHGRTLAQGYSGIANWDIIEDIASKVNIPIVGNGDLFTKEQINRRLQITNCKAIMLGRGPLRDPFLFLSEVDHDLTCKDYLEIIHLFVDLLTRYFDNDKIIMIQLKKHVAWMASGLPKSSIFRGEVYQKNQIGELLELINRYFTENTNISKRPSDGPFLAGGHG